MTIRDLDNDIDGQQQHRERLWLSPHCLRANAGADVDVDDGADDDT